MFIDRTLVNVNWAQRREKRSSQKFIMIQSLVTKQYHFCVSFLQLVNEIMAFEGRAAVISGGLGGIGYATAECLLQNGISVCCTQINISSVGNCFCFTI